MTEHPYPPTPTYLLYDRTRLPLSIPATWSVLEPPDPPEISDVSAAVAKALACPRDVPGLPVLARRADKTKPAVIVISDITRAVPNRAFLPAILGVLHEAGFADEQVLLLVATGMHRPSTPQEHVELVGPEIAARYRIVDHRAQDATTLTELPRRTRSGTCVRVDSTYLNAGLKIVTGFIEPHFMAGFSGGRKTICPGLVDLGTLQKFHGAAFLADPRARVGNLDGNPCHQEALDVARMAPPDFALNVTVNAAGGITGIFAGDMEAAHAAGVDFVRKTMTVTVDRPFDLVITSGGGYPLDTTFYQVVKGMVVAAEYVKPGGSIVIAGGCAQGIGSEVYRELMFRYEDHRPFLRNIAATDHTELDQWEFQMQARVLEKVGRRGLILATDRLAAAELRRCHVTPAADVVGSGSAAEQVQRLVRAFAETASVAVVPRGPYILPEVAAP